MFFIPRDYKVSCGISFTARAEPDNLFAYILIVGFRYYMTPLFNALRRLRLWVKATEQYFPVLLFIMLHKVVLTLDSAE